MNNRPIGIFDSGLGGLTVVKELIKLLPYEDIIYLGDTARVPYGTRSKETIIKFSLSDADFLLKKDVKCIVIACNTASSVAGKTLKNKIKIPVFDVIEPAMKDARKSTKGKIAVIGTRAAIGSGAYKVDYSVSCPLLVVFIEEGEIKSKALKIVINNYLKPLKNKSINVLILGCTHYPLIEKLIQKEMGKGVKLINPGKSVSKEVVKYLTENRLLCDNKLKPSLKFFVTDLTDQFVKTAEMFLGKKLGNTVKRIELD
jgi:glutamate racemase